MDGVQLDRVLDEKDLGVTITSTLSWELHIQSITAKANKVLGLLKRTCPPLKDISVRRTLYLSLVKPQVSYATQVWSPAQVRIEHVQRRATMWILQSKVGELSYRERLLKVDLLPLTFDRELKDLVLFYVYIISYI